MVDPTAFIAPTATLIGDVHVAAGASAAFHAGLGAGYAPRLILEGGKVQDGTGLDAPPGIPVDLGPGGTLRHCCCCHGAHIGRHALLRHHTPPLAGAIIGARTLVAAHALVVGGTKIPDEVLVTGVPAKVRGPIAGTGAQVWIDTNAQAYQDRARRYREGLKAV